MRAGLCVHAGACVRACAATGFSARVCARSFRGVPVRVYSPAHVCARVYSAGTFRTGHVEDPKEAFRPGEAEQRNGADAQFEHLPCRAVPCVYKLVRGHCVGAGVRLPFCRWRVGRRAYDVEGLALAALHVPGATVPRGPRQSCHAHDERHDERPRHEIDRREQRAQQWRCAREHPSHCTKRAL
jgi:hypothetical protein